MQTTTHTETTRDKQRRDDDVVRPLSLLVSVIRQHGGGAEDESQHKDQFRELLLEDGYEDYLDVVIHEWMNLKYNAAFGAANPPTTAELKQRRTEAADRRKAARAEVDQLKAGISKRALQLVMPNNKKLGDCTGGECMTFGGWFVRIGQQVGPRRLVKDVLTNEQLTKLMGGRK